MQKTLKEIAEILGGTLIGAEDTQITAITNIENPAENALTFAGETKHLDKLKGTPIAAVLVPLSITHFEKPLIQCAHPKFAWAQLLWLYHPKRLFCGKKSEQKF